ncbi:uncharacterized protein LOC113291170 [Papaver somniferum]|uniref:uncharacterized protein LOC113291170 n=1 Tax=Papaver somniferum TaxID=3469 RepID=UPI000E6FD3B6|nr:uncharacterized protein LOC113291170 [Papaver somniferum]
MVTHTNPGSVANFSYCHTDMRFESVTISFDEAIKGWQEGCRSIVGLDACHLNGKCGGVLMAATGLDGQNGLVTLGIGVYSFETIENWIMFLTYLRDKLNAHPKPLTFISDRQKGILEGVQAVFPEAHHRYCWRHLYSNFKKHYKGQKLYSSLWNAAKCYKIKHFQKYMEEIRQENPLVVKYLEDAGVESWDKPICKLLDLYNQMVMGLFHKRRTESATWNPKKLVPKAMKLIRKMLKLVGAFDVLPYVLGKLYEVANHEVYCLKSLRPDWTKYCSKYYTVAAHRATYAPAIAPFTGKDDWPELEEHEKIELQPALKIRKTGRPRVKRRRAWDEPKTQSMTHYCGICGSNGHNRSTCECGDVGQNLKAKRPRTQVDGANFTSSQTPAPISAKGKATKNQKMTQAFSSVGYVQQTVK